MTEKYCCVIDASRRYITNVIIMVEDNGTETVQEYTLKDNEMLIDVKPPVMRTITAPAGYLHPVFDMDTSTWAEGATSGEIAAWDALYPASPQTEVTPTQLDRVEAQATYTAMMTDTLLEGV